MEPRPAATVVLAHESRDGIEAPVCPDGVEANHAWRAARLAVLLAGHQLYDTLMWPTYRMLEALSACRSVDEVLRLSVPQELPPPGGRARSPEWRPIERVAERHGEETR